MYSRRVKIIERANELRDHIVDLRRTLHQFPEPGFQEFRTAEVIEKELGEIGGYHLRRAAGTGIIADIGPGDCGPLLRADMDALELVEESGAPYASKTPGMMHACGHDAHTSMLLGAARIIREHQTTLAHRVRLIFQPSEETHPGGALSMIGEEALSGVEGAIALHVYPQERVGSIAVKSGPMMANSDDFDVLFTGASGHAAAPQLSRDALVAAADFVVSAQKIVSRKTDPFENVVVTFGKLVSGTRRNIIAGTAKIEGTIRTLNPRMRARGLELLELLARCAAEANEVSHTLNYVEGYPVVVNHEGMVRYIQTVADSIIGKDNIRWMMNPSMGGEDFAYIAERVPSCFFRLGSGGDDPGTRYSHHNSRFNIDEGCLPVGTALLAEAALSWKGVPQ